ncbi:MAG: metallophosphoesterase [Planctomycetota bacterium]
MARTLVIGDIHEPVTHPGYFDFIKYIRDEWQTDQTIFIGDVVDMHGISFHSAHPEAPGPCDEYEQAHDGIHKWYGEFPKARVCIGNHDERIVRLAESVNIPSKFLRNYNEIWDTPGWEWGYDFIDDDVYYFHGTGNGGGASGSPAFKVMQEQLMSSVIGHFHTKGGVQWTVGPTARRFGMDTGCGVDARKYAFAYNRHSKKKPMLSCGVVIDGHPYHEMMPCGPGERFHRGQYQEGGPRPRKSQQ